MFTTEFGSSMSDFSENFYEEDLQFGPTFLRSSNNRCFEGIISLMEHKLAAAEKEVLEELVKVVQSRGMRGENGGWKEFLDVYDKKFGSRMSDPSRRSHNDLVAFLTTFKKKEDLQALQCHANQLLIEKFQQESPDKDTPEQSLVRLTVEDPMYPQYYSFQPYSEDWFVSDVGMEMSKVMQSTYMVAIDCEMVICEDGTRCLARVSAVDRNLKVILDEFVKPDKPIVDYKTAISGVTAEDIKKATHSVADIQEKLRPFLSAGAILVGHSLNNDFQVMKIDHPRIIDTSIIFKYPDARKLGRPSLNNLCKIMLGYDVHKAGVSHDSVQDAAATMKLVVALIEKRIDTTITLSKEMLEAEKSRLFIHRIPHNVPSEVLPRLLSVEFFTKEFTIDVKPAKKEGGYYCAVVIFESSKKAGQAFENVVGNQQEDTSGLPQKRIVFRLSSCPSASFCIRKMG